MGSLRFIYGLQITQDLTGPMQHSLKLNPLGYEYMTSTKYRTCPMDTERLTQIMIETTVQICKLL